MKTDCPICGAKGTVEFRTNITETIDRKGYVPLVVANLHGTVCVKCKDGFLDQESKVRFYEEYHKMTKQRVRLCIKIGELEQQNAELMSRDYPKESKIVQLINKALVEHVRSYNRLLRKSG